MAGVSTDEKRSKRTDGQLLHIRYRPTRRRICKVRKIVTGAAKAKYPF